MVLNVTFYMLLLLEIIGVSGRGGGFFFFMFIVNIFFICVKPKWFCFSRKTY